MKPTLPGGHGAPPRGGPDGGAGGAIPRGVWVLGFVSLLMDVSSEMVHSLLPLFLVGTLGVSVLAVGLIEGVAEATALISKVFAGALSDRLGRRKPLALLGYAMGALSKPAFALAGGAGTVVAALGLGVLNKWLEGWAGAVLAKIMVLAFIVVFIQKRPQGLFALKGRSAEA